MAFTKKIAGWVAGRIKGEQARKDTMRWMEKTGLGQILDIAGDVALTQGALKGAGKLKGLFTGGQAAPAATTAAKALPEGVTEVGRLASASPAESRALVGQMMAPKPMPPLPAPGAPVGPVTPKIGMPQMPTSLPPAGGAAPTPIASQVSAGMRPPTPPTPAPTFAAAPRPALPPAPSPMQAMVAPPVSAAGPTQAATNAFQSRQMLERSIPTPQTRDIFQAPSRTGVQAAMPQMARPEPNILQKTLGAVRSGASATMQYGRENAPLIAATAPAVANVIGTKIEQDIEEEKIKREQEARNRLAMLLMPMFQAQMGQAAPSFQPRG